MKTIKVVATHKDTATPKKLRRWSISDHPNWLGFRSGPVPYVHKFSRGSYFREIQTFREHRINSDPMHSPYVRGARRGHNLPDAWDDLAKSYHGKSWKHNTKKRKQWM